MVSHLVYTSAIFCELYFFFSFICGIRIENWKYSHLVVFLRSRFEIEFEKRKINNENVCSRRHFFDFLQEIAMSLFPVSLIVLFTPISIAFPELEIFLRSYLFNPSPGLTSFDLLFWIMCWNCFPMHICIHSLIKDHCVQGSTLCFQFKNSTA